MPVLSSEVCYFVCSKLRDHWTNRSPQRSVSKYGNYRGALLAGAIPRIHNLAPSLHVERVITFDKFYKSSSGCAYLSVFYIEQSLLRTITASIFTSLT